MPLRTLISLFGPARSPAGGSVRLKAFSEHYLCEAFDPTRLRDGPDTGVLDALTADERREAERLLLARLARGGDSRAAAGLARLQSQAAVEPLRLALAKQARERSWASPACAAALWQLARDPRAIEAAAAIAGDAEVQECWRVEAVVALAGMPSRQTLQVLHALLQDAPAYLLRYHGFKGLLRLHGYSAKEADDLTGPVAPDLAGALLRPAARAAVQARLAELLAGRQMAEAGPA